MDKGGSAVECGMGNNMTLPARYAATYIDTCPICIPARASTVRGGSVPFATSALVTKVKDERLP